jgi:uncharacterized protein (DUF885 family)
MATRSRLHLGGDAATDAFGRAGTAWVHCRAVTAVFDLADRYVADVAVRDAFVATMLGAAGHEDDMTDYSPDGVEARAALTRSTLREVETATPDTNSDRVCRDFMAERLQLDVARHDAGESWRALSNIASPVQTIRQLFDLCPRDTEDDWHHIATRMAKVPRSVEGLEATLRHGLDLGLPAARRQALECAGQAEVWGGLEAGDDAPFFAALAQSCPHPGLRDELDSAATAATAAYAELATFLREEYAPRVPDRDPVGRDRYLLAARDFLGSSVDPEETYAWGWDELHRIEDEMNQVAQRISPGASAEEAIELLNSDPARAMHGTDNLQRFLQHLTDTAIAELNGKHFDIPEAIRRCECMIAPAGSAAAMYYTPPSEDMSRPGRTWYPASARSEFPVWAEVTTAYHEGVPGHHLQVGLAATLTHDLSRYQRTLGMVSGHAEGWALYAERLMGELGYLENPDYLMGLLSSQIFRTMRVIVDIGLHLELPIPAGEENAGRRWSWELAVPFADRYSPIRGEFTRSEVVRYLGLPAQAISYKVGEREWLELRAEARRRDGAAFDLKAFHTRALRLGSLGLDQLRTEMLAAA